MENKEYYVEIAIRGDGLAYEVDLLTTKKLLEYCSDLAEINPALIDKIDLSGKTEIQWLYGKIFNKPHARNLPGSVFIVYAVSEEEALGKALSCDRMD